MAMYTTQRTIRFTCNASFAAKQLGPGDASFEDGLSTDSIDYAVYFRPHLTYAQACDLQLSVSYCGQSTTPKTLLFQHTIMPTTHTTLVLRAGELEYLCSDTHQLQVRGQGHELQVIALYLTLCNNNISTTSSLDLLLQPHVSMKTHLSGAFGADRYQSLAWFPPDVDPTLWGLRIDARSIPQRSPLWFKLRGIVSGSKAYQLLGFFMNAPKRFNAFAKSAMRLGTLCEDVAAAAYLVTFPARVFQEVGWCAAPHGPAGWGASPDGVLIDASMTWDSVPDYVRADYVGREGAFDITRGACEFKTSRTKLCCEAYFLAQVYMEMIALDVVWCDLVRYRPLRAWDADALKWTYRDVAHVYRVWRRRDLEARLMELWKRASSSSSSSSTMNSSRVQDEPPFVQMRSELEHMAAALQPYHVIEVENAVPVCAVIEAYVEARSQLLSQPTPEATAPVQDDELEADLLQVDKLKQLVRKRPRDASSIADALDKLRSRLLL